MITQGVKTAERCDDCGGVLICDTGQFIDRGRLCWGTEATCQTCSAAWCDQALADADRLADQLPEHERTDTWFGYSERKHNVHLSHALTVLGSIQRARVAQDAALAVTGPGSMAGALLRIDAAACLHRDGDSDSEQACRAATAALIDLSPDFRTSLTLTRAMDLYRTIPARHRTERAVQELHDVPRPTPPLPGRQYPVRREQSLPRLQHSCSAASKTNRHTTRSIVLGAAGDLTGACPMP